MVTYSQRVGNVEQVAYWKVDHRLYLNIIGVFEV